MTQLAVLKESFHRMYGTPPRVFSAPGRVNLIGEHTDYNQGFVLPMAANLRTFVAAAPRNDNLLQVYSSNLEESAQFDLADADGTKTAGWARYVEGIARVLADGGWATKGANLFITSEVPMGAGLSSSAALEIAVGFALLQLVGSDLDLLSLARAAQTAEHRFVGTQSGLMDQLTSVFGVGGHALLIDCRSLERQAIPIKTPEILFVVCDTKVKHALETSDYNQRRHECEHAVALLQQLDPAIQSLRDVSLDTLEMHRDKLTKTLYSRSRHVISENARTEMAAEALREGNVDKLGQLVNESHESLRNDFHVSCNELDLMVELARQHGALGARMMGGGFGGSTVNIVPRASLGEFRDGVSKAYELATGLAPDIFAIEADDGVKEST